MFKLVKKNLLSIQQSAVSDAGDASNSGTLLISLNPCNAAKSEELLCIIVSDQPTSIGGS